MRHFLFARDIIENKLHNRTIFFIAGTPDVLKANRTFDLPSRVNSFGIDIVAVHFRASALSYAQAVIIRVWTSRSTLATHMCTQTT